MVWVNGYNLGRFWKIGPQQTLYLPGCWLHKGKNEIIVLDLETPQSTTIRGLANPILDKINQDISLLHRQTGETLNLASETPVMKGSFPDGTGWKEVTLNNSIEGQYVCLEALSAQNVNDKTTSIAEVEIVGEDGNPIQKTNWKISYADSEEITSANNAADLIYDQQESTFWQSEWSSAKPKHPHQIVINLGEVVKIKGFKYLPRSDKSTAGMIKAYRLFIKKKPFTL